MKKLFAITILILVCFSAYSQDVDKNDKECGDDTRTGDSENLSGIVYDGTPYNFVVEWKNTKNKNHLDAHWTGFGMSFMDYNDSDIPYGKVRMSRSHAFSLNLASVKRRVPRTNLLVVSGIGLDWHRYHFGDNAALTVVDGNTVFEPAPEGVNYQSSKLLAYYVTVPLLLEYHIVPNDFYLSAGVVGFVKYYSKSQVKYFDQNGMRRPNMGRDLNMRPIDFKLRFQVGIDYVKIFGYYSPLSMFKSGKGPELNMYSVGFMIGF